jgi:hypothetical protein
MTISRTSFIADCNTTSRAFGYSNQNDDAKITALLQSGTYRNSAALAAELRVDKQSKFLVSALKRVPGAKHVRTLAQYNALGARYQQEAKEALDRRQSLVLLADPSIRPGRSGGIQN